MHMINRRRRRIVALAACAGLLSAPAVAGALDTTIRVEGIDDTIIPESAISIEGRGGTQTVYDLASTPVAVDTGSAFWQVYRAASAAAVPFAFRDFGFGLGVETIGPHTGAGLTGWQYKVNHTSPMVGAESTTLAQGDSVLWFYGGYAGARDLDIAPSTDRLRAGESFTVTVTSYDETGVPSPAAGATVTYGAAVATADAGGRASFIARGEGVTGVRASRAGDVRSATRGVCAYTGDPAVCNLPAAPDPQAEAPGLSDTVAPGSALTAPAFGSRRQRVAALSGTAGPDRSDVARVEVSVGLRVGTQCRFRTARGTLTAARDCARAQWLPARSSGTRWVLPLGRRPLTPGTWRIETRATDGAGNTESVRIPGANIGAIRVTGRVVRPVTRIAAPRARTRPAAVAAIRGTAGPARADITLVEVAAALRTPAGCRFVTRTGSLGAPRACGRRAYVPARSAGARWTLPVTLPAGRWTVWARARGADGVIGAPAVTRFTVTRGRA